MMRKTYLIYLILIILAISFFEINIYADNPQPIYGALSVKDGLLCGSDEKPVQLRGFSSHGLQWYPGFFNDNTVSFMKNNWNVTLIRAAMYTNKLAGGYLANPNLEYEVDRMVETAQKNGIYVIIDWHILEDNDPWLNIDKAMEFFTNMAKKHGDKPNVIFEICNEPNRVYWENCIKPYAEKIVPIIRQYSNNIIIIGTPNYCQEIDKPLKDPVAGSNLMYALHFYAGEEGHDRLKDLLKKTQEAKPRLPVFVSEFGTSGASGNLSYNAENTVNWLELLNQYNISWCNWALCPNGHTTGVLKPWTWKYYFNYDNLSISGKLIVDYLIVNTERKLISGSTDVQVKQDGLNNSNTINEVSKDVEVSKVGSDIETPSGENAINTPTPTDTPKSDDSKKETPSFFKKVWNKFSRFLKSIFVFK